MSLKSKYELYLIDYKSQSLVERAMKLFDASESYVKQIIAEKRTPVKKKGLAVKQYLEDQLRNY